ncbi:MAG: gyrase subunit A, DNA gyrase subunit A protein [Candidatus Peregrinibacteria bacterium GW2011_GWF2_38_29]|nr:MAG: gyrase subunit A, DNA gyrase subunit A protein [Candidatus Peregrinibacteria bacterium GW2011_GWF2_38_29]
MAKKDSNDDKNKKNKNSKNPQDKGKKQDLPETEPEQTSEQAPEQALENQDDSAEQSLLPLEMKDVYKREISDEMETCYLDYAMSVIVSRALPDVRDGLKPVHRRILYAMHEIGLRPTGPFRKSATVVGEVLGKYHPHGDASVYDALIRMAQDFSMRYPTVHGQGNMGSIDGDSPAAMRYTEVKLAKLAEEVLTDIDKDTVNWQANYDGRLKEPMVMPSKIPQLLLNGTNGIAVGMATSIPPHNLTEVIDGILHIADNKEATIDDLMQFIKGPDFPTGGYIYDVNAIKAAYSSGRGGIVMRAKASIEERKNGRFDIIITEIPYQTNKSTLVEKIAELVHEKKIIGITDIRDESNQREGIRVVIELKKDSYPKKILNQLFKLTPMQSTFNMNMIALADGIQPKLFDLKQILETFVEHRKVVITRRTQYDLRIAKERAHILEGLVIALDNIDEVIDTIRKSETKETAQVALVKKFKLSDLQANAILEMRLQTLAGLERSKIVAEYKEKLALIEELEGILKSAKKILDIMKKELIEIKEKYGDERRTEVVPTAVDQISLKDTIPNEPMVVMLTQSNYIKRMPPASFRTQRRGGKGVIGITTKEEDEIKIVRYGTNHDEMMFFTNAGRVYRIFVYEIPQAMRVAKGTPIVNLLNLRDGEQVTAILNCGEKLCGEYLVMATRKGTIKKTIIKDFENVRKSGLIAIKIRENDSLEWVREVSTGQEITIITNNGQSIKFKEDEARAMGRATSGVRGIRLKGTDYVVEMDVVKNQEAELLVIMENGLGKISSVKDYRLQGRGGSGIKTANVTPKTGKVVGAKIIDETMVSDLLIISKEGQTIRIDIKNIPVQGRATQGVYLMRMNPNDKVASISIIPVDEKADENPENGETTEVIEMEEKKTAPAKVKK